MELLWASVTTASLQGLILTFPTDSAGSDKSAFTSREVSVACATFIPTDTDVRFQIRFGGQTCQWTGLGHCGIRTLLLLLLLRKKQLLQNCFGLLRFTRHY